MADEQVVHLSPKERASRGIAARAAVPRSSHGHWAPAADRPDPIRLLEEQAPGRVPELVPVRHGRMLASPFAFYRGAAVIMAADLASTPRSGFTVQLCGDAHLSNFGVFGTPERQMIFDLNDFDETLPGPWEWDLKRLAASVEVAGRARGFSASDRRDIVTASVREYRETMARASSMGTLDAWYQHMDIEDVLGWVRAERRERRAGKTETRRANERVAKARTRDRGRATARLVAEVDGQLRFAPDPPLIVPIDDLTAEGTTREETEAWLRSLVRQYRQSLGDHHHVIEEYLYVDTARKVVGVGSVGTRAWIHLFVGRDDHDPLILQAKEAQASVLEPFVAKSAYANHGKRVVVGQRLMQASSDLFLGWLRLEGLDGVKRDYYVRQLHDWKGSVDVETMRVQGASLYARLCGSTVAQAHARWGDRIALAAYLGRGDAFDRAIADFSVAYADQNERDYAAFEAAVRSGRLTAETGL